MRSLQVELPGQDHNAVKTSWPGIGCWFWTAPDFQPDGYKRFIDLLVESFAPQYRLGRLKEFNSYFARTYPFGHNLFTAVQAARRWEEALARAEEFFRKSDKDFTGWERPS